MSKAEMIREIIMAVNVQSDAKRGTAFQTKTADGQLFFALAFRTEAELKAICIKAGISLKQ